MPRLNLTEHLHDERRLSRSRVTDDLEVLRLRRQRYPHHGLGLVGFETNTVALHRLVELLGRQHDRAFENSSVLHLLAPFDVFRNGKWELPKKGKQPEEERHIVDVAQPVALKDGVLE